MPRWQGLPVLTMGKTLKFGATSATTLPGTNKVKCPGRFLNNGNDMAYFKMAMTMEYFRVSRNLVYTYIL